MAITICQNHIWPILHHIQLITQLTIEREIVIRPAKTLTITKTHTKSAQVLVRVSLRLLQLLQIVGVTRVSIVAIVSIIEILICLVIAIRVTRLRSKENTGAQRIRSLTTQPRLQETHRCRSIVHTIGSCIDTKSLSFTLWHNTITLWIEEILNSEVTKLQS